MGKHAAPEGASADSIVTDALASRTSDAVHHGAEESPVGWPGEPGPEDSPVGWPGDLTGPAGGSPPVPMLDRSWRRLFGRSRGA